MKNKDINKTTIQVKDYLDKVSVSSEVIEHLNELINDKLDAIQRLSLTDEEISLNNKGAKELYEVLRYNNNYITLSYLITQEVEHINDNIQKAYTLLNQLDGTNKDDREQ